MVTRAPEMRDLAELLQELAEAQSQLLAHLERKRNAIAKNDWRALESFVANEESLSNRLEAIHQKRSTLLEVAKKHGRRSDTLEDLSNELASPKPSPLAKQFREASSKMRLLQTHTLASWVVAQRAVLHASQMIHVLASGGKLTTSPDSGVENNFTGGFVDEAV